ncbi:MAG: hypothetical protein AVDCRST_MAG01-01-5257 [uncultured Rubrobacteraceae bacterium]|uniref:Uncharacterized protein n=1 Tax=uncultured Rubrobacteraceae bacterium TaxID=349277 RepID=A0A6J4QVF5_9ACTN|nr:MAG: hypothetical protein AVDCRST_MAG01-01-5257 [uncultured Rubrobacteraceae bacterium]
MADVGREAPAGKGGLRRSSVLGRLRLAQVGQKLYRATAVHLGIYETSPIILQRSRGAGPGRSDPLGVRGLRLWVEAEPARVAGSEDPALPTNGLGGGA